MYEFDAYLNRIQTVLQRTLPDSVDVGWLTSVIGAPTPDVRADWVDVFLEPGRELLRRGGKRWRPLVTVLVCEALGGGSKADDLTILTEIPHTGSLIVDDVEDNSTERRGAPAIHTVFGMDMAINVGNLMYFLPSMIFDRLKLQAHTVSAIIQDWLVTMRQLHMGQGFDIFWHQRPDLFPGQDDYVRMCRFKTGSLASLAARLGVRAALDCPSDSPHQLDGVSTQGTASTTGNTMPIPESTGLPAGAEQSLVDMLGDAWAGLGTAFQILDDVQNLTTGVPGKIRGDDIVEGKKSLPILLHVKRRPADCDRMTALLKNATSENQNEPNIAAVEEAISLMQSSGAIDQAREQGHDLMSRERSRLISLLPECEARQALLSLVDGFVERMA